MPLRLQQHLRPRPVLAWATLAVAFALVRLALLPVLPAPEPRVHDEFSYLLAADTFAHGHVAGSPPAHPAAFEAPHILVNPVYASKYPPGQALVLAAGQRLFGHPYVGVVLSSAALIFLICWSASQWLPPQWAFVAGALAWVLLFLRSYWSESYWGGSVAACGGALVLGSLGYAMRKRWRPAGIALGGGTLVLYATRPFEGGILCATAFVLLLSIFVRSNRMDRGGMLHGVFLPVVGTLVFLLVPLAVWYNSAVTGDPLELPYILHLRQYGNTKLLWIQDAAPTTKAYSNERLRAHYQGEREDFVAIRGASWYKRSGFQTFRILIASAWLQFYGFTFFLLLLPWAGLGGRWKWLAILLLAGFLTLFLEVWILPHYSAPFAATQFAAIAAGVRAQWYRIARSRRPAIWVAIAVFILAPIIREDVERFSPSRNSRASLIRDLKVKGSRHLVLVDYSPAWSTDDEWVYNGYDLQNTPVLFAHFRTDVENRDLARDFPGRTVWRLTLGPNPDDIRLTLQRIQPL